MTRDLLQRTYEKSKFSNILHDIDGVYIPLDLSWKNIGISVSGGSDSALLAYLLCMLIDKNNLDITVHIISHIRMWKLRPWQRHNSIDVFCYLSNRFENLKLKRHENFIPPDLEWGNTGPSIKDEYGNLTGGDVIEIRSFAEFIGETKRLDCYYNAISKNPDVTSIKHKMEHRTLTEGDITNNFHLTIKEHMGKVSAHPFRFIEKDWIVKQYIDLDILDLFNLTRSCEGDKVLFPEIFKDLDYTTYQYDMDVPVCNECYWCQERNWALSKNGL